MSQEKEGLSPKPPAYAPAAETKTPSSESSKSSDNEKNLPNQPVTQQPVFNGPQPTFYSQPSFVSQPVYNGQQPVVGPPPAFNGQQPTTGPQPAFNGQQPTAGPRPFYHQQPSFVGSPPVAFPQPATNNLHNNIKISVPITTAPDNSATGTNVVNDLQRSNAPTNIECPNCKQNVVTVVNHVNSKFVINK